MMDMVVMDLRAASQNASSMLLRGSYQRMRDPAKELFDPLQIVSSFAIIILGTYCRFRDAQMLLKEYCNTKT